MWDRGHGDSSSGNALCIEGGYHMVKGLVSAWTHGVTVRTDDLTRTRRPHAPPTGEPQGDGEMRLVLQGNEPAEHLVHAIDRRRSNVTVCCIKAAGMIGEELIRDGIEVVVLAEPRRHIAAALFQGAEGPVS